MIKPTIWRGKLGIAATRILNPMPPIAKHISNGGRGIFFIILFPKGVQVTPTATTEQEAAPPAKRRPIVSASLLNVSRMNSGPTLRLNPMVKSLIPKEIQTNQLI